MNVTLLSVYGWNYSQCFQNNLILPTFTSQATIFDILESTTNESIFRNNKIFINHILLIFKLYVFQFREKKINKFK